MPNFSNRWEESGNFKMFGTSPKKASPKKHNVSAKNEISVLKSDLKSKTKKELQKYYESIGGDEDLISLTKEEMVKEIIEFTKSALGLEGGKRKHKSRRHHTRKAKRS
jgi:aminopeptidase C